MPADSCQGGFDAVFGLYRFSALRLQLGNELVIWGYFDESGNLADTDFICLCGYLSNEAWDKFTTDWGLLLKQYSLPALHMAPLVARRKPYEHIKWSQAEEDEVLRHFVKPIRENVLAYFGVALDAKYYRSMPREMREAFGQKEALDFAFQRLLYMVIRQLRQWEIDFPISTIFDYTENFSAIYLETLRKLRGRDREIKKLVSSITFADSDIFHPLQAADMLAYGTNRKLREIAPNYYSYLVDPTPPAPSPNSEPWLAPELNELYRKIKAGEIPPL